MTLIALPFALYLGFFTASTAQPAGQPAGEMAMAVQRPPMLEITKTCPQLRYLGREATFEITVTNRGEGPAANVVVTDAIPPGVEMLTADNGGAREGGQLVWRLASLAAGETRSFKATVRCSQIGMFRNTATVSYCATLTAACEMEVRGIPAILLECIDNPDPIEVNGEVTYVITVTNQGSTNGTGIVIACTLPAEQEYVTSSGPTQATAEGKSVRFAPLPTLAAKAAAVYKVTVRGMAVGDVRFGVELTSDQIQTPVMETESTHIY